MKTKKDVIKKEKEALLEEFLSADKDAGNIEVKRDFSAIAGEDFLHDRLKKSIQQSKEGKVKSQGSFAKYVDE